MALHKPEKSIQHPVVPTIRIEVSPEPSSVERAVIEAAVHHQLRNAHDEANSPRSRYGTTRLREFGR